MNEDEWREIQAALERDRAKLRVLQQPDDEKDDLEIPAFLRRQPGKEEK